MVRREIVDAVMKGTAAPDKKPGKKVVIAQLDAVRADFEKIAKSLDLVPGSKKYRVIQRFCEMKTPSIRDAKTFIHRLKGLSDGQLAVLEPICAKQAF